MEQSASWWHFWSLQRTHLKVLTSSPIRDLLWFTSTTGIKREANVTTNTWTTSTLKESVNKSPMLSRRGKPSREWWMEQDEEPWGVNWSLDLWVGLKSSVGASPDELTALGGGGRFLQWGWCSVSQLVLQHNAICSTPALCDVARCYSPFECSAVVRADFQFIVIMLWPGTRFILQSCGWAWM